MLNKELAYINLEHEGEGQKHNKNKEPHLTNHFSKDRHISFRNNEINNVFNIINSQEMARFVGMFSHFAYWNVFGNINPIQIDSLAKKQMYILMYELREYF